MLTRVRLALAALALAFALPALHAADPWLTIPGGDGPGKGKRVVLVSGDEEYRSEQTLTQLAKILARHHGFTCTVLYAIDPKDGTINPTVTTNIPGLEKLRDADLMVIFTRFRNLPDDQMKYLAGYIESGKPIVALRTATHAFQLSSPTYKKYTWNNKGADYPGGFGKQVLGETWVAHHGKHGTQGTRGIIVEGQGKNPILRGVAPGSIFGTTDVYTVHLPLPGDSAPLVLGEVTESLKPDSKAITGAKNDPMMPVAWTKTYKTASGKTARVFTTTMGAAQDFVHEGTRRMLVNACYWALGMEDKIPAKSDVAIVGEYHPLPFKFGGHKKGVEPVDLAK